jgi:hypothetical protein
MREIIHPIVVLPRMDAGDAITLTLSLKTSLHAAQTPQAKHAEESAATPRARRREVEAASAHPIAVVIPSNVTSCMTRLDACCTALSNARRAGDTTRGNAQSSRSSRKALFERYQRAWSAGSGQVRVWRETGALDALTPMQRTSLDEVFPSAGDGAVARANARRRWARGRDRLATMKARGLDEVFASLGAARVLTNIEMAHAQLAAELGVTEHTKPSASTGEMGEALSALQATLREYVIKVHALADPATPGTDALIATLLAPFEELRKTSRATPAKPATEKKSSTAKTPATPPVIDPHAKPSNTDTASPALRPTGTG